MGFYFPGLPPLSLYIHTPWCVKKCPYCDFNSHTGEENLPEGAFLKALAEDLQQDLEKVQGRAIQTVFIGGGTPSLLSPGFYQDLLDSIRQRLDIAPDAEITIEANPGTTDSEKFDGYYQCGINRLSIGAQSFSDHHLERIGRIHSSGQIFNALELARKAGFSNINIDLMYGLPGQSTADCQRDIEIALGQQVPHLSWYNLTIEPNTYYYSHPPKLPADENIADMQQAGRVLLESGDFSPYEISAWTRKGQPSICHHNENYWLFGDYLGIGPGAHSKITLLDRQSVIRFHKTRAPRDYLGASHFLAGSHMEIRPDEMPLEAMMNFLRLYRPIPVTLLEQRSGLSLRHFERGLETGLAKGFVDLSDNQLSVTESGHLWLDDLVAMF